VNADLDIYVESRRRFKRQVNYILVQVIEIVKRRGLVVRVLDRLDPAPRARAAFVHVDLTTVPAPYTWVDRLYPRCMNGRTHSIARHLYSAARLCRGDDYTGPVIVKSALNHRGLPDFQYVAAEGKLRLTSRLNLPRRRREYRELQDRLCPKYEILPGIDEVPEAVWSDSGVIVERFLPGNFDLPVVKYRYNFMLDCAITVRAEYDDLLCAADSVKRVEFIDEVPGEVLAARRRLDLDYGAIDYFVVEGRATVVDVNKTITSTPDWVESYSELRDFYDELSTRLCAWVAGDE